MLLCGPDRRSDYLVWYIAILTINEVHRHFSLPYVYLDKQVRGRHPCRFIIFPAMLFLLWLATPFLMQWNVHIDLPPGIGGSVSTLSVRGMLNGIAVVAALWTVWHVYMQKYGILRMYNAKSNHDQKVPGWVDRLLICCWIPLFFAWLGPHYRDAIARNFYRGKAVLMPMIDGLTWMQPVILPIAIGLVLIAIATFIYHEYAINSFASIPRMCMAFGTTMLSLMFFVADPIKVYLAFSFSHAIEYMVFVWAFQKKRYAHPLPHKPMLGRLLRRPWISYAVFSCGIACAFLYCKYWGVYIAPQASVPKWMGFSTSEWLRHWSIYQSLVHFYFDGMLWKMRMPSVRASI